MVLTDHQIAVQAGNGLLEHYDPSCITNIGYDLRAEYFVSENKKVSRRKICVCRIICWAGLF